MKKMLVTSMAVLTLAGTALAADGATGTVRSNFIWDVDDQNVNFNLTRAYFGYSKTTEGGTVGKVLTDVDYKTNTLFIKNAYFTTPVAEDISFTMGVHNTSSYTDAFKFYGKGYMGWNPVIIQKSPFSEIIAGDGSGSADNGATVTIKSSDQITINVSILQGLGYKKLFTSGNQDLLYAASVSFKGESWNAQVYQSINPYLGQDDIEEVQSNTGFFVGWKNDQLRIGHTEALTINANGNSGSENVKISGEIFAAAKVIDAVEAFLTIQTWQTLEDESGEQVFNCGLDYKLDNGLIVGVKYEYQDGVADNYVKAGKTYALETQQSLGMYTEISF